MSLIKVSHAVGPLSKEFVLEMCHKTSRRREGQLTRHETQHNGSRKQTSRNHPPGNYYFKDDTDVGQ